MQEIDAKPEEILLVQGAASREVVDLDHREPEEIETHRQDARAPGGRRPVPRSFSQLA